MNSNLMAGASVSQGHFKGIAVVIDDQVHSEPAIQDIVAAIKSGGGHVIPLTDLPNDNADLENLAGAAFFILDWNLVQVEPGVPIPEMLAADQLKRKVEFLKKLRDHRHAPVFIFTNDDPAHVTNALSEYPEIYQGDPSHILVRQKASVGAQVYRILNEWAEDKPSVQALKSWERANDRAANSVFKDLHDRDPFWPVFMWKMFEDDALAPPDELGRLITRLVASRMLAPTIDLSPFLNQLDDQLNRNPERYRTALMSVLEGERFLRQDRLDPDNFWTGDVFTDEDPVSKKVSYYINLLPECDCIDRPGRTLGKMHLLKGREEPDVLKNVDPKFGRVNERDNEEIVIAMIDGKHIRFAFNSNLKVQSWDAWKKKRIGRLLPPFLTRLLERYAAYSHRPGLPRIPSALLDADNGPAPASKPVNAAVSVPPRVD